MNEKIRCASGTPPPFVRHLTVTVAGLRHGRGTKRVAPQFDLDDEASDTCAGSVRPCFKKIKRGTERADSPALPGPSDGSPLASSKPLAISLHSSGTSGSGFALSFPGESGAIAVQLPERLCNNPPNPSKNDAIRSLKRRADPQDEIEEPDAKDSRTNLAKRPRTDTLPPPPPHHDGETPIVTQKLPSGLISSSPALLSEEKFSTLSCPLSPCLESSMTLHTPPLPLQSDLMTTSHLFRWQSPRTSPLGPQTAQYRRRSRISAVPNSISLYSTRQFLNRNVWIDNLNRDPYHQSPQWCEDLHRMGLNNVLHPTYCCTHDYHPSDPGYDEEWAHETWSDEDWSDDEDALATPPDTVATAIVAADQQPRSTNGWKNWQPPRVVPSQVPGIRSPSSCLPLGCIEKWGHEVEEATR